MKTIEILEINFHTHGVKKIAKLSAIIYLKNIGQFNTTSLII